MNDIQAKENIYNASTAAVGKQHENVSNATTQVAQAQNAYLQSVVRAAMLSEKTRRKKDSLIKMFVWGGCSILALLLLLINAFIGVPFIVAVVIIAVVYTAKQHTNDDKLASYNNRKSFFTKYSYAVPANVKLKWKNGAISYTGNASLESDDWKCPQCSAKNTHGSNFCISCRTKKP